MSPPLPRWIQVIAGLVLLAWVGVCTAGAVALIVMEPRRNWLFTKTVGGLLLLGSIWGIAKCIAMIRGPASADSALISPWVLRGFAVAFAAFPILGLMAGTVTLLPALLGLLFNASVAYGLFRSTTAPPEMDPATWQDLDDEDD
jgi:hypothetical protein